MKAFNMMAVALLAGTAGAVAMPKVGDVAPDLTVAASDGSTVKLKDLVGKSNIVLYFYPKDDTPGCTKEACGIRDTFEEFKGLNAIVFGASFDSVDSHKAFVEKYKLPFRLLADTEKKVAIAYGVANETSAVPRRVTFIINKAGKIAFVFPSVNPSTHANELRTALTQLAE